ncbi:ATP-dependent helicase HrpB [Desulfobaculum sp. SPO524]|uniref:ATP-dependent helicase HrpB n=1 Tax=Desulfobaculum sp. SPO524 TaxID=3378071 RepID=UPI00385291BE
MTTHAHLPIDDILPDLRAHLGTSANVVLHAPPGAGKTTRVPVALLGEPWMAGKRIIMLEPRRLAARSAARFMARQMGERVGATVGYRVRAETKVSRATRIEVVTEGVLTRMIQAQPDLPDVACLIFDEFHERSLHADLGLALALECQDALREDLRIVVMSATLDCAGVSGLMENCPVLSSAGRAYPVETIHLPPQHPDMDIAQTTALAVRRALREESGSILVFLPGAADINRTAAQLGGNLPPETSVHQLFGALPQQEQDAAIAPPPEGRRKVVLATSIAETSLTIEGIRVVIDAGYARVPRFDPGSGMTRLTTERVSTASADQRRGRAGRLGPGLCYRLWSAGEDRLLKPFPAPEIQEADLAPLVLELAQWGVRDAADLKWLDLPPQRNMEQAREVLQSLGALGADGGITAHGRALAALPIHPRLAHMVLMADAHGFGRTACAVAALIAERDILRGGADMRARLSRLIPGRNPAQAPPRRISELAARLARTAKISGPARIDVEAAGPCIALAYPDRVAQRTGDGQFRLSCGRAGWLPQDDALAREDFLAVADLDGNAARARIWRAAPVLRQELEDLFPEALTDAAFVEWDARTEAVVARSQRRIGRVILSDAPLHAPAPDAVCAAVVHGIRQMGLHVLPWDAGTESWRTRVAFLRALDAPGESTWPDVSDEALLETLEDWLAPFLTGLSRRSHFKRIDLAAALNAMLPWDQQQRLAKEAPTHLRVPDGGRVRIDYSQEGGPALPVKLQRMFGVVETPRIAAGRYALAVHLLSPAGRPLQITRDLKSFWENGYRSVKAEMKGRYPKHHWPDDPFSG